MNEKFTIPMDLCVDGNIIVEGSITEAGTMEVSAASATMTSGSGLETGCYICDWFMNNVETLNLMLSCYSPMSMSTLQQQKEIPYGLKELPLPY